jgi:hypothetical protein
MREREPLKPEARINEKTHVGTNPKPPLSWKIVRKNQQVSYRRDHSFFLVIVMNDLDFNDIFLASARFMWLFISFQHTFEIDIDSSGIDTVGVRKKGKACVTERQKSFSTLS